MVHRLEKECRVARTGGLVQVLENIGFSAKFFTTLRATDFLESSMGGFGWRHGR